MMTLTAEEIKARSFRGKTTLQRFHEKVKKTPTCWLWKGCIGTFGYGHIRVCNDHWPAHRFSWTITYGDVPKGLYVLHKCDVPNCVNPEHLFLGTYKDNFHDAMKKGRWWCHRGENVGTARFSEAQVSKIKTLWLTGKFTKVALAKKFQTSDTEIRFIVTEKYWKHVKPHINEPIR